MILFVFTSDGGSREDGNVYYATYLIIHAEDAEKQQVMNILRSVLPSSRLDGDSGDIIISYEDFSDLDDQQIPVVLRAAGFESEWLSPSFIVRVD